MSRSAAASDSKDQDLKTPRYLRFVSALVLGAGVAIVPAAIFYAGCGDDKAPVPDTAVSSIDAPVDASVVDGPLPPPELARQV